jgi:hypothetical protein
VSKKLIYIIIFNIFGFLSLFFVVSDLSAREVYARSIGFTITNYYLPLLKFQLMKGAVTLESPPTLDWVQLLLVSLLFVDTYYFVKLVGKRGEKRTDEAKKD